MYSTTSTTGADILRLRDKTQDAMNMVFKQTEGGSRKWHSNNEQKKKKKINNLVELVSFYDKQDTKCNVGLHKAQGHWWSNFISVKYQPMAPLFIPICHFRLLNHITRSKLQRKRYLGWQLCNSLFCIITN